MQPWVIFLDDGGVMNDNRLRGMQWQRLVGTFFAPRLGGAPESWAEANRIFSTQLFEPASWQARLAAARNYQSFAYTYYLDWVRSMCALVGVKAPGDEVCQQLGIEAEDFITPLVHAAIPGAVSAIRTLHRRGYQLHTASGEPSRSLAGYLQAMEIQECFQGLYGPDLIDTFKIGSEYYTRIFAQVGIDPATALVVDNDPLPIAWARQAGARTAFVGEKLFAEAQIAAKDKTFSPGTDTIASLADLPDFIERLV